MEREKKWTRELVESIARKYTTMRDFRENNLYAYNASSKYGWLKDFTWLQKTQPKHQLWTKDKVFEIAKRYTQLADFRKEQKLAYFAALNNGWFEELTWLQRANIPPIPYQEVEDRARKYKTMAEFKEGDPEAYARAVKRKWMKRFDWMEKRNKPHGYWTRERVEEEARKYDNRKDFLKNAPGAFDKAYEEGWLDEFDWLPSVVHIWTYDELYEEAKKYKTSTEFHKANGGAYKAACNRGYLKDYTWFESPQLPKNTWTKEKCIEVSKQCATLKEFREKYSTAYCLSVANGWRFEMPWFQTAVMSEEDMKKQQYLVYMYFDEETLSVYIGLSRDFKHRKGTHKRKGTVCNYFRKMHKPVPEPIILENNLTVTEAQYYEGYYVDNYRLAGYNVLNKVKTGGLGGIFTTYNTEFKNTE